MQFDVTLTNPPFTKTTNGSNQSIYQKFYNLAVKRTAGQVGVICPKNLMLKMHRGKIRNEKIVQRRPTTISFDNVERHFDGVGSSFCWFVIDNSVEPESSTLLINDGEMQVDVLDPSFEYVEAPAAQAFIEKYGNGERYTVSGATVGKRVIDDPDGQYVDVDSNTPCYVDAAKKFSATKIIGNSKFVTVKKMTSGKPDELIADPTGKYVWTDNMHYSIIIDDGADLETVKANAMSLIEEFKVAFAGIQLNGFVWTTFFQTVAKHHLNGNIKDYPDRNTVQ